MTVIWTPDAEQDLADIWDYIAADNPTAAVRMDELFSQSATALGDYPNLGKPGLVSGTRELIPHASYRLVYEVDRQTCGYLPWYTPHVSGHQCVSVDAPTTPTKLTRSGATAHCWSQPDQACRQVGGSVPLNSD